MLGEIVSGVATRLYLLVFFAGLCTVAEVIAAGERQTWLSRLRGFGFWLIFIPAETIAVRLGSEILYWLGAPPLLHIDLTDATDSENILHRILGYTVFPFLAALSYDFFYYFFHRLQHSVPFLWRFHAVHHSIEELNSVNSYHHVSEYFIRIPLMMIPMGLLLRFDVPQTLITIAIIKIVSSLAHANTTIGYGPLRYIMAEPRYHRVHHSLEQRHWDRNFAFSFPVWDVLFRTAYFPRSNEFPRTGLADMREPKTIRRYLFPKASDEGQKLSSNLTASAPRTGAP